jgi:hypothetical protein
VLLDVALALGGSVGERRHRVLEPARGIVERIVAARRALVLEGIETREQAGPLAVALTKCGRDPELVGRRKVPSASE